MELVFISEYGHLFTRMLKLFLFPIHLKQITVLELIPPLRLDPEKQGYFSGILDFTPLSLLYGFRLDDNTRILPDPASRFQPQGTAGLSQIINSSKFHWTDHHWNGVPDEGLALYEMHIGTFTPEGTWEAATGELEELAWLGINVIELMPAAEFEGTFNWGYDGIFQFAPTHNYGSPDDFRRFVDQSHKSGISVILDVVYNHLGPGSNFFGDFSPYYFSTDYKNEWGLALNFDGPQSGPVREYFLSNARFWIEEFHLDGLRIDATQQIFDSSPKNIMREITETIRASSGSRRVFIIGENEPQHAYLMRDYGIDAMWNDDFHRAATVALSSRKEAYFSDYSGSAQEFISAAKYGYLYQGQLYTWQGKARGTPSLDLRAERFIHYLQNHDQVANSLRGQRITSISEPSLYRAFTALLLLGPQIPLLFQGQEFNSTSPFYYFTNRTERAKNAALGRKKFLSQFKSIDFVDGPFMPDPTDPAAFISCKLDFSERSSHKEVYLFHHDLLQIRNSNPVFRTSGRKGIDGAVLGSDIFALRYLGLTSLDDKLLIINMGKDTRPGPVPEPLIAPPEGARWKLEWYSEDPHYGGNGISPIYQNEALILTGHTAFFMSAGQINR